MHTTSIADQHTRKCMSTHTYIHTCVVYLYLWPSSQRMQCIFSSLFSFHRQSTSLFTLLGNYMRMHVYKYIHTYVHMCLDTVDGLYWCCVCLLFLLLLLLLFTRMRYGAALRWCKREPQQLNML